MLRTVSAIVLGFGLFTSTNFAYGAYGIDNADEQAGYDFVAGKAEQSLRIVTGGGTKDQKLSQLRGFFSYENFAWETFSWMVLGRVAREVAPGRNFKKPSDAEAFKEYTDLMRRYFTALYAKHLANYDSDTFEVRNVVGKRSKRELRVEVMTQISERDFGSRDQEPESVDIEFELCDREESRLKVCNATVMGFNLLATFRDDHNRMFYDSGKANWSFKRLVEIFRRDVEKAEDF